MNIIEAIKSGKKFRRSIWYAEDWREPHEAEDVLRNTMFEALIAEDWEVEQQVIPLTKTKVIEAWSKALKKWGAKMEYSNGSITPIEELLKELGFEE
jgi:hypothetical protein